jgi:hypothetical protein
MIIFFTLYLIKNAHFSLITISAVSFLIIFYLIDHIFDLNFDTKHYVFITIMAIFGILMGPFFFINPHYDKVQHLIFPIMLGSLIFHLVRNIKLQLKWKLIFVFFIILGSLTIFELLEYAGDLIFDLKLQGVFIINQLDPTQIEVFLDRLDDTMVDLFLGLIGAAIYVFSIAIFFKKNINNIS